MAKYWVEYTAEYQPSPMSHVVHQPLDCEYWSGATKYAPPLPRPEIGKGYRVFRVEVKGIELSFSSLEEVEHCIEVLSHRNLPTTQSLAQQSWLNGSQHVHWLTKLPSTLKPFKERQKVVRLLTNFIKSHNQ